MNPPSGCPFQTRCPRKIGAICETDLPPVQELSPGHNIMCHLPADELRKMEPIFAKVVDTDKSEVRKPAGKKPAVKELAAKKPEPKKTQR
jgi:hypothetical protein